MSLIKEWNELTEGLNDSNVEDFWKEYSDTEKRIYEYILEHKDEKLSGKVADLVEKFSADKVIFMGFLDGIQTSLNNPFDLEEIGEDSEIELDIDFEKLLFNMFKANADYLYTLPQWEQVLPEEKLYQIARDYKDSKTVRKEREPGRNDPCPCGSGKKYKKCCGAVK